MFSKIFQKTKRGITPVVATALLLVVAVFSILGFSGWFNTFSSSIFSDIESDTSSSTGVLVEDLVGTNLYIDAGSNSSISKIEVNGIDCNINGSYSGLSKFDISFCLEKLDTSLVNILVVLGDEIVESYEYFDLFGTDLNYCSTNTLEGFFNGSGSLIDPFIICNCNQLQNMENYLSNNFEISSNIDCSDSSSWNLGLGFQSVGKSSPFIGSLDGGNFTISDIYNGNELGGGLFGKLDNSQVSNLNLDNIDYVNSRRYIHWSYQIINNSNFTFSSGYGKLTSWDFSDINNIKYLDSLNVNDGLSLITSSNSLIYGNYLISSKRSDSLIEVFDISDPYNLVFVKSFYNNTYFGNVEDFKVSGDILYIGDNVNSYLSSWNISNINDWIYLDHVSTIFSREISIFGDVLIAGSGNLNFINISDPSNLNLYQTFSNASIGSIKDLKIVGNYMHTYSYAGGNYELGYHIWNMSNFSNPVEIGHVLSDPGTASLYNAQILVKDNFVFYSYDEKNIRIVDFSNPLNPVINLTLEVINSSYKTDEIIRYINFLNDDFLSVYSGNRFFIYNFSDVGSISLVKIFNGIIEFGFLSSFSNNSVVNNVHVSNTNMEGMTNVGGLLGYSYNTNISSSSTDNINIYSEDETGGLIGKAENSNINNSFTVSSDILGMSTKTGGLIGYLKYSNIYNSYTLNPNIRGDWVSGGLIGLTKGGLVSNSYAKNINISTTDYGGGLVSKAYNTDFENVYATGDIYSNSYAGGLIAYLYDSSNLNNGYSDTYIKTNEDVVGGLVGVVAGSVINNSYTVSKINTTSTYGVGALVGTDWYNGATVDNSYWNSDVIGVPAGRIDPVAGKTTLELQTPISNIGIYSTWDLLIWDFGTNSQYPKLFFE